jgi:hypothetical protein
MKLLNEYSKGTNVTITWIANKLKNMHPEFDKGNTLTIIDTNNADVIIRMNEKTFALNKHATDLIGVKAI